MVDADALSLLRKNLDKFISKLTIIDKNGKAIPFEPNQEQHKIFDTLHSNMSTIILKPRQIGASTGISASLFATAFTSEDPITIVVLTHKAEATKQIIRMHHTLYDNLPKPIQNLNPATERNKTLLQFESGARIIGMSARADGGLRTFTANIVHISEFAFAKDPEELLATATAAVNDGQLIYESTANFPNDALYNEITKYLTKQYRHDEWSYLFFAWCDHKEYSKPVPKGFQPTQDELVLLKEYNLTKGQLVWRRSKIAQNGIDKFLREYPLTLEEAYRVTGSTYFRYQDFEMMNIINVSNQEWTTFEEPKEDDQYAIGVDTSGGVGRDYAVVVVMSKRTNSPVLIYRSNTVSPIQLAEYIQHIAERYNRALVLVEANNYGLATINELSHVGYNRLWKEQNKDFLTTTKTKPLLFENLRKQIRSGLIRQLDSITVSELRSIIVDEKGIIKFGQNGDSHCDSAMALALCCWCLDAVSLKTESYLPKWIREKRSDRIRKNSGAAIATHRRY